jgi:hypothetical protein
LCTASSGKPRGHAKRSVKYRYTLTQPAFCNTGWLTPTVPLFSKNATELTWTEPSI